MNALALDTNALIRFLERGEDFSDTFARYDRLIVPAPVDGEFRVGCDSATKAGRAQIRLLEDLLADDAVRFAAIDERVSAKYADLFRYLKGRGVKIPQNDVWIAAVALVHDATLCTFDAHFSRIPLLRLERLTLRQ